MQRAGCFAERQIGCQFARLGIVRMYRDPHAHPKRSSVLVHLLVEGAKPPADKVSPRQQWDVGSTAGAVQSEIERRNPRPRAGRLDQPTGVSGTQRLIPSFDDHPERGRADRPGPGQRHDWRHRTLDIFGLVGEDSQQRRDSRGVERLDDVPRPVVPPELRRHVLYSSPWQEHDQNPLDAQVGIVIGKSEDELRLPTNPVAGLPRSLTVELAPVLGRYGYQNVVGQSELLAGPPRPVLRTFLSGKIRSRVNSVGP